MKFTAAVLTETGKELDIIDNIEVPVLREGQVLVKLAYSGICHSQLMEAAGKRGPDKYLPHLLGHEGTGIVVDRGPNVSKVKNGDSIILGWIKGSGIDAGGSQYQSNIGRINAGAVTTFNEYAVVSENRCYLLPDNITMQQGVLLGCAFPTGMGVVLNQAKPLPQQSIGILGLGGIGCSALVAAKQLGVETIVAIDINNDKLALAKSFGATHCFNPQTTDLNHAISEITSGQMLDYVIEAAGSCKTIELAFSLIHRQTGECIFTSHPPNGEKICLEPHELICGKKIEGSWGGSSKPEQITQFVSQHNSEIPFEQFMSNVYKLSDINEAMSDLARQKVVRAIIQFEAT